MKKILLYILFVSVIGLIQACQKDSDDFIPTDTTVLKTASKPDTVWENEASLMLPPANTTVPLLDIEKLNKELAPPTFNDTITAERGGKINLSDDMYIEVPSNACVNKANVLCRGKVDFEVMILRTKGELIAYDKPTVASGRLLTSGGVFYISAKQNGSEVRLALNKSLKIRYKMPTIDSRMQIFSGKFVNRLQFDWAIYTGTISQSIVKTWADSLRGIKGYEIICDRLGWISCNTINESVNNNAGSKFCVAMPDTLTNRNTSVYVVLKNSQSVVKLEGVPALRQFCLPATLRGLPIGQPVTVVSMTQINGSAFMDIQEVTITATNIVRMKPQRLPIIELRKKILSL